MTFADQPIGEFLDAVASEQVTPSGGAVAPVGGAMGAALCEMVCIHTVDTDGSETAADELIDVGGALADQRERLLDLADEDAAAVDAVGAAFESGDADRIQAASKRSNGIHHAPRLEISDIGSAYISICSIWLYRMHEHQDE